MTQDIRRHHLLLALRWLCYVLVLVLCYCLQTNRTLFSIGGIRPVWLVAVCIALSAFEDVFPSTVYAMFAGLLWDASANRLAGSFAVLLMGCCFLCCSAIHLTLRRTSFNVAMLCLATMFIVTGIDYLFTYVLYNYPNRQSYYVGIVIPTMVYTVFVSLLLYALFRFVSRIGQEKD